MSDKGWVKLHRTMLNWEWYDDANAKILFLHLLLTVNYEDGNWHGMTIERGSRVTSLQKLSEETGLSLSQTRTALDKLKKTGEVASKTTNKFTLVTVENYEKFQGGDVDDSIQNRKQIANKSQTNRKQIATIKEIKKNENKKNIYIGLSEELISTIDAYKEMRTKMRKPMTDRAVQMLINKLKGMCDINSPDAIAILEQSIERNWLSVFPLNKDYTSPTQTAEKKQENADKLKQMKSRLLELREQQTDFITTFQSNQTKENFDKLTACNTEIGRLEEIISKGEKNNEC